MRRAISTALAQTEKYEVIVVDDCSTDETQEYVTSLSQSLVKTGYSRFRRFILLEEEDGSE